MAKYVHPDDRRDWSGAHPRPLSSQPTHEQMSAIVQMLKVIADLICELGQVPSGDLYIHLQTALPGLSLLSYDMMIGKLVDAHLIRRKFHLITWIGPKA